MFKNVRTLEELRIQYKELLKKYHPDNGGSLEECQKINVEYEELFKRLKNSHKKSESEQAEKKWSEEEDENIRQAIYNVIHFEGLNIEIVGCWIWVDGSTYPYRDELKKQGYVWSKSRQKWHFSPYEKTKYYKGKKKSFEELREIYGSNSVKAEKKEKIAM